MIRSYIAIILFLNAVNCVSGTVFVNGQVGDVLKTVSGIEFEVKNSDYIGCPLVKVVLNDEVRPFNVQTNENVLKLYSDKGWDVAVSTNLLINDCTIHGQIIKTEPGKPFNIYVW